jgi:alanine racemase
VTAWQVRIDETAITENTQTFTRLAGADVLAVVKGDGYGHGAVRMAAAALAGGAQALGVTSIADGMALRDAGLLETPIVSWLNADGIDAESAVRHRIDVAVASRPQLIAASSVRGARVHLHVDTGMSRDGSSEEEWEALLNAAAAAERSGAIRVVGLMSHLACADAPDHPRTRAAHRSFARAHHLARMHGLRPSYLHLAGTAATITDATSHLTLVRVGAGLAGIDQSGRLALRETMHVSSRVIEVRRVRRGDAVGYGATWVAERDGRVALIAGGYSEGMPRGASGSAELLVRGRRRPVIGGMSMNACIVDLADDEDVGVGDAVIVLGRAFDGAPTLIEWAGWATTIPHEIVCSFGAASTPTPMSDAFERASDPVVQTGRCRESGQRHDRIPPRTGATHDEAVKEEAVEEEEEEADVE